MRRQFEHQRRVKIPDKIVRNFNIETPGEVPREIRKGWFAKSLPWLIGIGVLVLVVVMFATGARQLNPMYLVFMTMMVVSAVGGASLGGGSTDMSTPEVDSTRGEYLRYLSTVGDAIRRSADSQRANAEWSNPDPDTLDSYVGTPRMLERGPGDADYLKVRIGLDEVKLESKVKAKTVDSELDLEAVGKTALDHMLWVQQSLPHCPKTIDLAGVGRIVIYGDRDQFAGAVRAWLSQLVCFHTPNDVVVAVVSDRLDTRWDAVKWLPHTESPVDIDGAGPARYLSTSVEALYQEIQPRLDEDPSRPRATLVRNDGGKEIADPDAATKAHKHIVVVVDDPDANPMTMRKLDALDGVTVIAYRRGAGPGKDYESHSREYQLRIDSVDTGGQPQIRVWERFQWQLFCEEPDFLELPVFANFTRLMSGWDSAPQQRKGTESAATQSFLDLLDIDNAAHLDRSKLWPERSRDEYLRAPIGLRPDGSPFWIDLKDETEGGYGPHGLWIGMTGSGKSTTLQAVIFAMMTRFSPDDALFILADFKGEAGFDAFAGWPAVIAIISNLTEKRAAAERFGDTLLGLMDQRERVLADAGRAVQGEAFANISDYNAARATERGKHLPKLPTIFVIVDEFTLMIEEYPEIVGTLDKLCRKGRTLGVFFGFSSQTLDVGKMKDIEKNLQYRCGLKVSSPSISRQVIGTEDAYNILPGPEYKGTGFFVKAPGATPERFRSFLLPKRYEPPVTITRTVKSAEPRARLFTAGRVEPDPGTVIEKVEKGTSFFEVPRSLVQTVGPQLAEAYGKELSQLWSPPLDDPIPLDAVLAQFDALKVGEVSWPLGELDEPRMLRHDLVSYGVSGGNVLVLGGSGTGRSTFAQTFVLSAASRYTVDRVGFYILGYGGPEMAVLKNLPHVGALATEDQPELTARILGDMDSLVASRRRLFGQRGINLEEYRALRERGDTSLDDGYPTDLFLVVDGWDKFLTTNTGLFEQKNPQRKDIARLAGAGYGIHVVITATDSIPVNEILGVMQTRFELKLFQGSTSTVRPSLGMLYKPNDRIPADQPGRGITASGQNPGTTIRFAVGRTDGKASTEELTASIRQTVDGIIARQGTARRVPEPVLMPTYVDPSQLHQGSLSGEKFALGLRGSDLQPLVLDFADTPLLATFAGSKMGKTTVARQLLRAVVDRRESPDQIMVCVFDPGGNSLRDETSRLVEGADFYESDPESMAIRALQLGHILRQKAPTHDLSWAQRREFETTGPKIYLIIDNVHEIPVFADVTYDHLVAYKAAPQLPADEMRKQAPRHMSVLGPVIENLSAAAGSGLRVIVTHSAAGAALAAVSDKTMIGKIIAGRSNLLMLGSTKVSDEIRRRKFEELPPGRGYLLPAIEDDEGYIQVAALADDTVARR